MSLEMNQEIFIRCHSMSVRELKHSLEQALESSATPIRLEERHADKHHMRTDPNLLVALVGAAGAGIGALITGLLAVAQSGKSRQITLEGKSGRKISFPADADAKMIEKYIELAKTLDIESLII